MRDLGPCCGKDYVPGSRAFADSEVARTHALWLYSRNDRDVGSRYPCDWLDTFTASDERGDFKMFAPAVADEHLLFWSGMALWGHSVQAGVRGISTLFAVVRGGRHAGH